ncbi:hypothetical protein NDU88_004326 [Pleurodeles waltl]|uniref:Uncharacterized protein n=1 Tax=Pleurodeles waltl TaxID=8319 RepID=A0AAV7PCG5_PLEWA|nr:hypothetical protein NDU88_004326 [Pleurodeles waltl]
MRPTCAAAASVVQEHHGAATNERRDAGSTQEGGGTRRSASEEQESKEKDEERDGARRDETEEQEEDEEITQGQRTLEAGEWLLPNRGEEDDEAADGGLNTAATLGSGTQSPATLLEKRGITRCVDLPY